MSNHLQTVRQFLEALNTRGSGSSLQDFYHPEALQVEYPNTLTKNLTERDLPALKAASERGKKVLSGQHYEIVRSYIAGDTVIIEAIWTGTLAIPIGQIPSGGEMKAWFAQFFEFRDGKIFRQRNYDCFEPF